MERAKAMPAHRVRLDNNKCGKPNHQKFEAGEFGIKSNYLTISGLSGRIANNGPETFVTGRTEATEKSACSKTVWPNLFTAKVKPSLTLGFNGAF